MPDYVSLAATTRRLIEKSGRLVSVQSQGSPTDVAKPWLGNVEGASVNVYATFTAYDRNLINGTSIQAGDQKCVIAADGLGVDLTTAEEVLDGSRVLTVVSAKRVAPGSVPIAFELQVR